MARARHAGSGRRSARKLHEWRKLVKDLRYAMEILERAEADVAKRSSKGGSATKGDKARKQARDEAAVVHALAKRADDLGELLGEDHDLAVLAERVRAEARVARASGAPGLGARKALLKAIARRRRRLRKQALRDGKRLYKRKPKRFIRRVRAATTLAALSRR
jgi:CHAD domain-containing protein